MSTERPPSPSHYAIALWWIREGGEFVVDLGEPACFACGWYDAAASRSATR